MLRLLLIRPGATTFVEQGRIQGCLDLPLSDRGREQVASAVQSLAAEPIERVYASPVESARATARSLAAGKARVSEVENLRNLNHGLWQGKRVDEVRQCQPKVYRQWQEHPETVCPPDGESLAQAQDRVRDALAPILKRHRRGTVAIVVPEPLASLIRSELCHDAIGDLWNLNNCGRWELLEIAPPQRGKPTDARLVRVDPPAALGSAGALETRIQAGTETVPLIAAVVEHRNGNGASGKEPSQSAPSNRLPEAELQGGSGVPT